MSAIPKPAIYLISICVLVFTCLLGLFIYLFFNAADFKSSVSLNKLRNLTKAQGKYTFINPADEATYEKRMIDFLAMENMAQDIFPIDTARASAEKSLSDIKDVGIYYWTRNLEVLASLKELHMPKELVKRTALLKEYCEMNKQCYELMYKAVKEHRTTYDPEIEALVKTIEEKRVFIKANY